MSRTTGVFRVFVVSSRLADLLVCSLGVVGVADRLPRLARFSFTKRFTNTVADLLVLGTGDV